MTTDLTPCQEHVQMLRASGLFAAGVASMWDTDTDKPDAQQRQAIADAKAGCLDCPAFDACRLELDARMRDGEDVTGIVAGTDRTERAAMRPRSGILHGTPKGYRQHARRGIPYCDACREANRIDKAAQRDERREHGTPAGYKQHLKADEIACRACKDAVAAAQRARMASRAAS